jgi:ATP-dependent Zn protease
MAERTINENREGLTELAELLLEREVVFTEDVERIFGPREPKPEAAPEAETIETAEA